MTLGPLDRATSLPRHVGMLPAVRAWWAYRSESDPDDWALRSSVCRFLYRSPINRNSVPPRPTSSYRYGRINTSPVDDRGFYTFRADPEIAYYRLREWLGDMARHIGGAVSKRCPRVIGRVSLFGEVCVHELGYRSEALRIDRLWIIRKGLVSKETDWDSCREGLERRYQCDVEFFSGEVTPEGLPELTEQDDTAVEEFDLP